MVTLNTRTYVPAVGDKSTANYVIVAEQPGKHEVERRTPMVGPAGENLNECLHNARIPRRECYITNVVKDLDHDLKYYIDMRKKDPIQPPGIAYMDILKHELSKTSGIIIAMGNVALYALTDRKGITNWRGSVVESTLLPGRICIPTFHPATYTQDKLFINPKLSLNRVLITYDLIRAREQSGRTEIHKTSRKVIIRPPAPAAMEFLKECAKHPRIYYDIELINNEMSCISFAYSEHESICIPFVAPEGQFYSIEEELMIMEEIASLLESPDIVKVGQNIIFDSHFLHSRYGIHTINMDDTMIAQGLLMPEYPKGLNFITSMWTDINYYKDEGKIWLGGGGDWNNGYIYNGLDSLACAASFHKQIAELEEINNIDAYNRQVALIEPLTYMMERGVRVNMDGYGRKILDTELELQRKGEEIYALMGDINPNSPIQLMDYFYNKRSIPPILNKKRKVTTDEFALIELAGMGHKEAQLILDWRGIKTLLSRYLDFDKIDKDGRLRCSYNPVGTRYGRISSSKNIYGTGMNMQNLPPDIRTYLIADDGYIIYSIDLSQAENRIVAYIGNIDTMIDVFQSGRDMHRMTAALIYGVNYDQVTSEQREWGKRANHGFNYGLGPSHFSTLYQIPLAQSKAIRNAYHKAYPRLEYGYWKYVQDELRNNNRTLTTLFGRKIKFYQKYGEQMLNEAYSAIPQGTVGEMINERAIKFLYYNDDPIFSQVQILTQTHDSIDFEIPVSLGVEQHADIILQVVASLESPLKFQRKQISIPCDLVINHNLNKQLGIEVKHAKLSKDKTELADLLKRSANELELRKCAGGKGKLRQR